MRYLLILITGLFFVSCSNKTNRFVSETESIKVIIDSIYNKRNPINKNAITGLFIKDSMDYSSDFINSLIDGLIQSSKSKKIKTIGFYDSQIIIDKHDTIKIPIDLPLDSNITYYLAKQDSNYTLKVKRIKITDIYYELRINSKLKRFGIATLNSSTLIFGNETGFDVQPFIANEYFDNSKNNLDLLIESVNYNRIELKIQGNNKIVLRKK
jgi:hypothetical protein